MPATLVPAPSCEASLVVQPASARKLSCRAVLAGLAYCAAILFGGSPAAGADSRATILIVTSFPSAFYEPFRRAFEQKEPGYRLRIVNRKTGTAIMQVSNGQFARADVFWASSPDAFEVLKAEGRLAPLDIRVETPERAIGRFPLDDPDGLFRGFAVSGYGMMWNNALLQRANVAAPHAITDLTDPRYRGLLAMSSPSRSGTTHLMVETVLQRHGWEKGWAIWQRIAGNLATITARSFTVSNGVAQGRFGVGLSIDFLGRSSGTQDLLGFAYPAENVFLPASIALLAQGQEPEGGRRFVRFVLSREGQALLSHPDVRRQPLRRSGDGDLFTAAQAKPDAIFDSRLSGGRYELVNLLFDELIAERLVRLQRFWRRFEETRQVAMQDAEAGKKLAEIEADFQRLPPLIAGFGHELPQIAFRRLPRGVQPGEAQAELLERIRQEAEAKLLVAERALEAVSATLEAGARAADMGPR
ncbi:MAG: extracellular solute-binding protein [Proteobacteria bacterium]|nr:extracellular solute-binding protein [Pseudomonadota bacterium]